jgi:hypothetical protein
MTGFKVLSAGLIVAAMLATPVMAQGYRHVSRQDDFSMSRGDYRQFSPGAYYGTVDQRDCVRAPNVGAYASDPYVVPPCEPGSFNY